MIFVLYLLALALTLMHPIEAFVPAFAVYRPVLVLSVIVLALAGMAAARTGRIAAAPRHLILFGLFAATIAISQIVNGWVGGALDALTEFGQTAILFISTLLLVTTTRRLKITCAIIALCMLGLATASISAFHTGFMANQLVISDGVIVDDNLDADDAVPTVPADDVTGRMLWRVRSWGFFSDPNDFSQAMIATLPLLAVVWLRRKRIHNLLWVWLPAAVLIYTIYLTHSRGALLGLAALVLFSLLRKAGYMRTGLLLGVMVAGAVFVGFTGGRSYSSSEESAGGRIDAWSEGMQMLRSNPVFGVGYGNFIENFNYTAHNSFVLCFAELGLVGYFAWLGMIVLSIREARIASASAPEDSDESRWSRMLRLSMIGFLVCAWFLSRTYQPLLFVLIALCFASAYCAHRLVDAGGEWAAPPRWQSTTVKLMIASIVVIYIVVRLQNAFVH